jgi:hypothetical protein
MPADPIPLPRGDDMLAICCGNEAAADFLMKWHGYCHRIDDVVDEGYDEEKFLAAAVALNVDDFNLPAKPAATPVPVPVPEPEVKTTPVAKTLDLFNKHPHPAVSPEPQVTHVSPVAELVRKLKAAMAAENYTELHITESGVQFKRVQVTEGTLDI